MPNFAKFWHKKLKSNFIKGSKMGAQSVEPNVADKINGELRSYKLNYKL